MRLRRLELARYGKFTDRAIEFGERQDGRPDMHIVYGPNEAGKSTALAGYLDLLFGIEPQSRYGFLHSYETMRLGGLLELSVGNRDLVRIKLPAPTLRDKGGAPVAEALVRGDLGGLDRNAYKAMFSLDDDTLEAGGDSILASNGELGQLLFSASAGLAELGKTLAEIRTETRRFTWPRARSGELHDMKAALDKLRQERAAVDMLATDYKRLAGERDRTAERYDAAISELSRTQADLARAQRTRAALPRLAALRSLRERLVPLSGLPSAPAGWLAELPGLQEAENRHRSDVEHAEDEVRRLINAIEALGADERGLRLVGGLDLLTKLTARYTTAAIDLPLRRQDLAVAGSKIDGILAQLGRRGEAEPERLVLSAAQSAHFEGLIESRSGIAEKVAKARDEHDKAVLDLDEARGELVREAGEAAAASLAAVKRALQAYETSDHAARLKTAAVARQRHADALAQRMADLRPWAGAMEALSVMELPSADTLTSWHDSALSLAAKMIQSAEDAEKLDSELARQTAALASSHQGASGIQGEVADARQAREAAWVAHRRALDAVTADTFEAAMRRDDAAATDRLALAHDAAGRKEAERALAATRADAERAAARRDEANAEMTRHAAKVAEALGRSDAALATLTPAQMSAWLGRRNDALTRWGQLVEAEQDLRGAEADAQALRQGLLVAMSRAGIPADPEQAVQVSAQAAIDRAGRADALRQKVAGCEKALRGREAAVRAAVAADDAWLDSWRSACCASWLGAEAAIFPHNVVRGILTAAAALGPAIREHSGLEVRVRGMEDDQVAFGAELARLAAELAIDSATHPALALAKVIEDRVHEADRTEKEREKLADALAKAEDQQREARDRAWKHVSRAKDMMERMGAESLIELAGKLRDAEAKADLEKQVAEVELEIQGLTRLDGIGEAEAVLDAQDRATLEVEEARLAAVVQDLEQRTRELFAASRKAADAIDGIGGDEAAARIEERRRTHLLEIDDKARRYLRLRLGVAAADRALRAYRDQHRSAMLAGASDAFRTITRGAYTRLGTQPGKDGDVLMAIRAEGGSRLAAELSKGTRFQLYLALRAAGYREFAALRPSVPFIADDIMETFDDGRAEETFRVLADMSRLGQVIYFTHHGHLRVIAERTVPGVRVHDLAKG